MDKIKKKMKPTKMLAFSEIEVINPKLFTEQYLKR